MYLKKKKNRSHFLDSFSPLPLPPNTYKSWKVIMKISKLLQYLFGTEDFTFIILFDPQNSWKELILFHR